MGAYRRGSSPPWPQNRPRTQPCKRTTTHADRGPPTTWPLNPARTTAIAAQEHWHGATDRNFMCHLAMLEACPTATAPPGSNPSPTTSTKPPAPPERRPSTGTRAAAHKRGRRGRADPRRRRARAGRAPRAARRPGPDTDRGARRAAPAGRASRARPRRLTSGAWPGTPGDRSSGHAGPAEAEAARSVVAWEQLTRILRRAPAARVKPTRHREHAG